MIGQMKTLLRVKALKMDQAFRAMQAKRRQLAEAQEATRAAIAVMEASRRALPGKIDAAYAEIIGNVVDLGDIDEVKGKVLALEQEHAATVDDVERCRHVEKRIEGELEQASERYRQATKDRDKYTILTDEMGREIEIEAEAREEVEIEDLFSRPKQKRSA